jgi:phenylalanyl-tRNA synthetase alpha subunit
LEAFVMDKRSEIDIWWFAGRILDAVDRLLPGAEVRISPTEYPMCERAFSLDVRRPLRETRAPTDTRETPETRAEWVELMAWGQYAAWVLRGLGADPARHAALGAGFGLERCAMLKYGIDDARKIAGARVA